LEEGGYSLSSGDAGASIGTCEAVVGGAALHTKGVGLSLELADGGLDFLQLDVRELYPLEKSQSLVIATPGALSLLIVIDFTVITT
jgi:hypothetical protein